MMATKTRTSETGRIRAHYDATSETYYITRDGSTMSYYEGGECLVDGPRGVEIDPADLPSRLAEITS